MKRYIVVLIALCAVSLSASAQVAKQVEVTKDYAPEIGEARKMDIAPNMVDTITIRPEIDYSVHTDLTLRRLPIGSISANIRST